MSRVALQVQALKMHCRGPVQVEVAPCKISLAVNLAPAAPAFRAVATPARTRLLLDAEDARTCRGKDCDRAPTIWEDCGQTSVNSST